MIDEFKMDDLIEVRNSNNHPWVIRHFAGISENGYALAFVDGHSSDTVPNKIKKNKYEWIYSRKAMPPKTM